MQNTPKGKPPKKKQTTARANPKNTNGITSLNLISIEAEIRTVEQQLEFLLRKRDNIYENISGDNSKTEDYVFL